MTPKSISSNPITSPSSRQYGILLTIFFFGMIPVEFVFHNIILTLIVGGISAIFFGLALNAEGNEIMKESYR